MERRLERTFEVVGTAAIKVDGGFGTVTVNPVPGAREIVVVVTLAAETDTEAGFERKLGLVDLAMRQSAEGRVELSAKLRRAVTWSWNDWPPLVMSCDIRVPERCDVDVTTGSGAIRIGSLSGRVSLTSDSGQIFAQPITGSFTAASRSGSVSLAACTGDIEIATNSANITVGRAGGRTVLTSRGGYIEAQRIFGELVLRGDGSSAHVGFASPIRKPADIEISGGDLVLKLESNAAGELDLRASRLGRVELNGQLPLAVSSGGLGRSALRASCNGGGPRLLARASGGNVWVRAVEPLAVE